MDEMTAVSVQGEVVALRETFDWLNRIRQALIEIPEPQWDKLQLGAVSQMWGYFDEILKICWVYQCRLAHDAWSRGGKANPEVQEIARTYAVSYDTIRKKAATYKQIFLPLEKESESDLHHIVAEIGRLDIKPSYATVIATKLANIPGFTPLEIMRDTIDRKANALSSGEQWHIPQMQRFWEERRQELTEMSDGIDQQVAEPKLDPEPRKQSTSWTYYTAEKTAGTLRLVHASDASDADLVSDLSNSLPDGCTATVIMAVSHHD